MRDRDPLTVGWFCFGVGSLQISIGIALGAFGYVVPALCIFGQAVVVYLAGQRR